MLLLLMLFRPIELQNIILYICLLNKVGFFDKYDV